MANYRSTLWTIIPHPSSITFTQIVTSIVIIIFLLYVGQVQRASAPAEDWYKIISLEIPDHPVNTPDDKVLLILKRELHKPFIGKYHVEEQIVTPNGLLPWQECHSEIIGFSHDRAIPDPLTIDVIKRNGCKWRTSNTNYIPGKYRTCIVLEVFLEEGGSKLSKQTCSNIYAKEEKSDER